LRDRIKAIKDHAAKLILLNSKRAGINLEEQEKLNAEYKKLFSEFPQILIDIAEELEAIRPAINREV
jgi:hypothetical protein